MRSPFKYSQKTGNFYDPTGNLLGVCYAGKGEGLNNPALQYKVMVGPLPQGFYAIMPAVDHAHLGPCAMQLVPLFNDQMKGRSDFFIHADRIDAATHPHDASNGCIIASNSLRQLINSHNCNFLEVVE